MIRASSETGALNTRLCTCHPDDKPPVPCPGKHALWDCRASALIGELTERIERLENPIDHAMIRQVFDENEAENQLHERSLETGFLRRVRRVLQEKC